MPGIKLLFSFSCRHGTGYAENLGYASLTVWNMKTWKAMVCNCVTEKLVCAVELISYYMTCYISTFMKTVLPLGEDPPAITSLSFNHNGKILAAAATDGMIHMFGILKIIIF